MKGISVVIATKNEERHILDCLEKVKWADEIIIVDMFSTDKTIKICQEFTNRIFQNNQNQVLNINKNLGFEKASFDWILELDADERITPELEEEIKKVLASQSSAEGYLIKFKNYFFGKFLNYGGWNPDYHLRLFKKGTAEYNTNFIHEQISFKGKKGVLKSPILHYSYETIEQFIAKTNFYTSLEVLNLKNKNIKFHISSFFFSPLKEFLNRYLRLGGYKDGWHGLIIAFLMSQYILILKIKHWEAVKKHVYENNIYLSETQQ